MSKNKNKGLTSKHLLIVLSVLLVCIGASVVVWIYTGHNTSIDELALNEPELKDPLPGELVMQTLLEDSVQDVRRQELKKSMTNVIQNYRKKFRHEHFTGYFLTDLDDDGFPELWVKVGKYRDNAKLELYYPMPDGTLRKSSTHAEPGQYYIGDSYLMQVVGSGPGYIDVNRISIRNGEMQVDNERGIDLYADPTADLPNFAERVVRDTSFSNLTPINNALSL